MACSRSVALVTSPQTCQPAWVCRLVRIAAAMTGWSSATRILIDIALLLCAPVRVGPAGAAGCCRPCGGDCGGLAELTERDGKPA